MTICRLHDTTEIRRRLDRERHWALYALADLDADMFTHCDWWGDCGDSLALVFRALEIRPIFVMGDADETRALLTAIGEPWGYLNLQIHQFEAAAGLYAYRERRQMRRMMVEELKPRTGRVEPLGPAHEDEVRTLYAMGERAGIGFAPFQLATGMFRGIRDDAGALVAVAGVHVLSTQERVAGVGNIFTHPDHRGRGHAQTVTSAVVAALLDAGITTIGLNVEHDNRAAIAAYERIGFRTSLDYYEGTAVREVSSVTMAVGVPAAIP